MKKFIPAFGLILITLLFISCSTEKEENVNAVLLAQIQGKWKLTEFHTNTPAASTVIANGYQIEFKSDGTFTSDEENGYIGGKYTVLKTPGNNIRLAYARQWEAKLVYKYINAVYDDNLFLQASSSDPVSSESTFNEGYTLTRIP